MTAEADATSIVLLPHQEALKQRALANDIQWPMYLIWQMGSGKTFGALAVTYAPMRVDKPASVLVLCPLSLVGQWRGQIRRFMTSCAGPPPNVKITVAHYEQIDRAEVVPRRYDLVVVDEAARFRNAFKEEADEEGQRPEVLHYEIRCILRCPRILYLSGTPILASARIERRAFDAMMRVSPSCPPMRRVSVYDPRDDPEFQRRFATRRDTVVRVPMLWSQCLLYFIFKRRPCKLRIGEETLVASVETGNAFDAQLVKIANNPFTSKFFTEDDPESSPKIARLVERVEELVSAGRRQLVYSSRKGEGVEQIRYILVSRELHRLTGADVSWRDVAETRATKSPLPPKLARMARELLEHKFLLLSGDMSGEERHATVQTFNRRAGRYHKSRVLLFTVAAANGVDLYESGDIHLLEPNPIKAMEDQVIARGLRLYAHRRGDKHKFGCYCYVATFPKLADSPDEFFPDVLGFFRQYRKGADSVTPERLLQIRDALFEQYVAKEVCTIDEKHLRDAAERHEQVTREVRKLSMLDPDGRALLGQKQEAGWARRSRELSREMRRADSDARASLSKLEPTEPSGHGWDGASRCSTAVRYMKDWWARYLFEDYPGMYDQAWRNVRRRISREGRQIPDEKSAEADVFRADVRSEVHALGLQQRDIVSDRRFYRQVVARDDLSHHEVRALKRAMIANGYIDPSPRAPRGWKWRSAQQTYKVVPRPGQRGHDELIERFEEECMTAQPPPKKKKQE